MNFKNLFSAIGFTAISLFATAQTFVTNGGFETWTGSGNTIEPTQWNSNKTGSGWATSGPQTCFQETGAVPHSGTYCVRVQTGSYFGTVVNGSLATGQVAAPSTNKSEGYIHSKVSDVNYRMPFTGRPDSLVFWVKYTPSGSDWFSVEARLHTNADCYTPETPVSGNHPDATATVIARAIYHSPAAAVSSWTRMSVPFAYVNANAPAYILISSTSSGQQTGGVNGSQMWLDDFDAIYNPALAVNTISPLSYSVSAISGAPISVPFTLTGTYPTSGNTVTAQLSDASGSFASPITLGSIVDNFTRTTTGLAPSATGTISGTIPANTPSGAGYRVRVITSSPALISANNGSDITINLAASTSTIAPVTQQNILTSTNGTLLTVTESPAGSSREWKYATVSGGPYSSFTPTETGTSYTPNFATAGTYYIVCESQIGGMVRSNEVVVVVSDPVHTLATNTVSGSPFLISAHANVSTNVTFTSSLSAFNAGNVFTVEISDELGGFATPTAIGTYAGTTIQPISVQIPNTLSAGTQYRIRVKSSDPAIIGTENTNDLTVIPFTVSIAPTTTQTIEEGVNGTPITVTESHTATREWKWKTTGIFNSWSPAETGTSYTPNFASANTYYVKCVSINAVPDTVESNEVVVVVEQHVGITGVEQIKAQIYQSGEQLIIQTQEAYDFALFAINGQMVLNTKVQSGRTALNVENLTKGIYAFRLGEASGRVVIR